MSLVLNIFFFGQYVNGHGYVQHPPSRHVINWLDGCPQCGNNGGPGRVSSKNKYDWPHGSHGFCGDPQVEEDGKYGAGAPVVTYKSGSIISVEIFITANHGGLHQLRLCPDKKLTERCFAAHTLRRVNGNPAGLWVHRDGGKAPGAKYSLTERHQDGMKGELYTVDFKLPKGVTCKHCVLQWYWTTGSSCDVPGTPTWMRTSMEPCGDVYPEEFWNCIDVQITKDGKPAGKQSGDSKASKPSKPKDEPAGFGSKCSKGDGICLCKELSKGASEGTFAVPYDCSQFLQCIRQGNIWQGFIKTCDKGLMWDTTQNICNHPHITKCGSRPKTVDGKV